MQLSVRSMLATGVALTTAAGIVLAPPPGDPLPSRRAEDSVVLTGAWEGLDAHVREDLANLAAMIVNYPPAPILSQLAQNLTTYQRWLAGEDGGTPMKVVQTMANHAMAVGTILVTYSVLTPLSFVGSFIAPGVAMAQLIIDTATYPSTPQTVLQAFIDAPAVYLDTALNCCSTALFKVVFGLLNPGPLGYLLALAPAIAKAMSIPAPPEVPPPPASAAAAADEPVAPSVAQRVREPAVGQSRRSQSVTVSPETVAPRSSKRPEAVRKAADASARKATADGKGHSARPGSRGTR